MTYLPVILSLASLGVLFGTLVAAAPTHIGHEGEAHADSASADTTKSKITSDGWQITATHGPTDTLTFETSEATWMNVDVSPDGTTLVFDILGDLYELPMTGGTARRLTDGPAYDHQPRLSPDGKFVLFTSDRGGSDNLWTLELATDEFRPVTADADHIINSGTWTPDGEYVVGRKRLTDGSSLGTVELWMYHRLGGSGLQVTKQSEVQDTNGPVVSPDGRWVYYSARHSRYQYNRNVYEGFWQIEAYDRDTGTTRNFTDGYGGSARPAVSPDGTTLSFVRRDREKTLLMLHDLATGEERVLFEGLDPDMQENFAWTGSYPGYDWTPDGKEIVISYDGTLNAVSVATGRARNIPFTASVQQSVRQPLRFAQDIAPETVRVRMLSWPSWAPKRDEFVFSALGSLYRLPARENATPQKLNTPAPRAYAPSLSADGSRLTYVSWSDANGGQVHVMPATGGSSRAVTTVSGQYANPVFSPDGKRVAYLRGSGTNLRGRDLGDELWFEIHWSEVSGGESHYVVTTQNRGSSRRMPRVFWSADGTRLFYGEETSGGSNPPLTLVSVRLDGTDRREHLKVTYAEEIVPSPDGKWAAFTRLFEGFVTALPELGREAITVEGEGGPVPSYKFSDEGADWLNWTPDAKTISWGYGPELYRVQLADVLTAWDKKKTEAGEKTVLKAEADTTKTDDKKKDKNTPPAVLVDTLEVVFTVPRAKPVGTYALTGARIITMNGDEVINDGTIVVEGDRIVAVGAAAAMTIPSGTKIIDVTGKTIMPGLIDAHAHLGYSYLDIIPQVNSDYYANLAYGVTTTHDPSASTYATFTQHEMVEAGVMTGPRVFSTGFILYGADIPNKAPVNSLDDARHHIKRMRTVGAFSVKSYMQPRRDQRQWIIQAASEESIMVCPEGGGNLEMNLGMVLDGHTTIEHSLPVTPLYKDVVTLMAQSGVGYTPTLLVAYGGLSGEHWFYQNDPLWKNEKLLTFLPRGQVDARSRRLPLMATDENDWHHMDVAAGADQILKAGGLVTAGAHGQLQGLGMHWETWSFTQGGMSEHDALRVATIHGAKTLGLDAHIGSLEPGKLADFVVLDENPLFDIRNTNTIRYVAKNGELWDGTSMDKIWPKAEARPAFPWQIRGSMLSTVGGAK